MSKLALRRVIVQPEFVLIDGDKVTDVEHPAVAIPADEWPTYRSERFPREVAAWQVQIDAERHPNLIGQRAGRKPNRSCPLGRAW